MPDIGARNTRLRIVDAANRQRPRQFADYTHAQKPSIHYCCPFPRQFLRRPQPASSRDIVTLSGKHWLSARALRANRRRMTDETEHRRRGRHRRRRPRRARRARPMARNSIARSAAQPSSRARSTPSSAIPRIGAIVVAIHPDDHALFAEAAGRTARARHASSTAARHGRNSTLLGLAALDATAPDIVLIHDGVRPFVDADADRPHDRGHRRRRTARCLALPVSDTLKRGGRRGHGRRAPSPRDGSASPPRRRRAFPSRPSSHAHRAG